MKRKHLSWIMALVVLAFASLACSLTGGDAQPSGPTANGNDSMAPAMQDLTVSSQMLYYGGASCGPATLTLNLKAWDDSGALPTVGVQYRVAETATSSEGNVSWQQALFTAAADGTFSLTLDVGALAQAQLNGRDGVLLYQVYAMDGNGNYYTLPQDNVYSLPIQFCGSGQAGGGSTANTGGSSLGGQGIVIDNVRSNGPVYTASGCGSTALTLSAQVQSADGGIQRVFVRYTYRNRATGNASSYMEKEMQAAGNGLYSVTIDVAAEAGAFLNGAQGLFEYQIFALDVGNSQQQYPSGTPGAIEVKPCSSAAGSGNSSGSSGSGGSAPPQPSQLSIVGVQFSPNPVYYGSCSNGENTMTQAQAEVEPLSQLGQIASITVYYDYGQGNEFLPGYSRSLPMSHVVAGSYVADIQVASDLSGAMSGDAWIEGYVEVIDTSGNINTSSIFRANVYECAPPLYAYPSINYFDGPANTLAPGDAYTLSWDTSNANCGVFLDGSQVNPTGSQVFFAPSDNVQQSWFHTLLVRGGDCNNPTEATADVQIFVAPQSQVVSGSGALYNGHSVDLGDGGADISYSTTGREDYIAGVGGAVVAIGGAASIDACRSVVDSSGSGQVMISPYDVVCYRTGSGNYGYLVVNEIVIDTTDLTASYIDISYSLEIFP